jgi:penicillin-binding protein 1A
MADPVEPAGPAGPQTSREALPARLRRAWRAHPRRSLLLALSLLLLALALTLSISWSQCWFQGCPDVGTLGAYQPGRAPVLLDRNGEVFADLTPVEHRMTPLFSLPSHVAQAFLAVEDQRFYEHHGIDWRRVGGATLANLKAGGFAEGFSTITMQLARNLFPKRIPGQEQSVARKLLEVRVAREIEAEYSKEEILELYLNNIYFGNRAYGIEAAARQYFGVPAARLTLPQAALLAALPKAPGDYDPRRHPDKALERRNLVLALMEEQKRIPARQAEEARRSPLGLASHALREERLESGLAPYFVEQVRQQLEERFGNDLYTQALRVRTTLDSSIQRAAEEELRRQLRRIESGAVGAFDGPRYSPAAEPASKRAGGEEGTPYLQGAAVVLDAERGDVLAWVGGRDFAQSQFDRAAQASRQAGSAFKPFVYAAALADGYVLSQPLLDEPLRMTLADGQVWEPRNFTGRFEGRITMRDALVRSKNVATVRLADAVGLGDVAKLASEAGVAPSRPLVPALALGTAPVSPRDLTAAYTAFASLGRAAEPRFILSVETEDKKVVWRPEPRLRQVLDPGVAYLVTNVLSEALERGTGIEVRQSGLRAPAAGKTGTTNDGADAWFVGYTPDLAAGVWIGFDQPRPIVADATGGRLAAPVWANLIQRAYRYRLPPRPWSRPRSVVARPVDPATGLVLEEGCSPTSGRAYEELFLDGKVPAAYCPGREKAPRDGFPVTLLGESEEPVVAIPDRETAREEAERLRQEEVVRQAQAAEIAERKARLERRERALREQEEALRQAEERERRAEQEAREELEPEEPQTNSAADLSGWWELTNRIESTSYPDYQGLRLTYRIQLEQDGGRIEGRGQKWAENGRTLGSAARTPITVTGRIDGNRVELRFTERGARRTTGGSFSWTLSADRTALRGRFQSSAADTSGRSIARRMP